MTSPLGITVMTPDREDREVAVRAVQAAEEMGVHSVWVGEHWGRDALTFVTELALETKRIGIGTGILNVYGRSPAILAQTFAHLDEISDGRMYLGLGASTQALAELWHGVPYDRPLRRLRECVEIINRIVAGQPLNYEGEIFHLTRGMRLRFTPPRSHIPIALASVTPRSNVQTGEIADIWLPGWWPKCRLGEGIAQVRAGAARSGRPADACRIFPEVAVFLAETDREVASVRAAAREHVSFYLGRMGGFYPRAVAGGGFAEEVAAIQAGWAKRDAAAAAAGVSDRLLDEIAVVGTPDDCVRGLDEWRAAGADVPVAILSGMPVRHLERNLSLLLG